MTIDNIFEEATLNWRDNKGIGTAFVPRPLNDKVLVYQILAKMYARNPTMYSIIVTNTFTERTEIIDFLITQDDDENNKEFKNLIDVKQIRIFTVDFILKNNINLAVSLAIWYKPSVYNQSIAEFIDKAKFKLIIITKLFTNNNDNANIYKLAPLLDCFKEQELNELRVSSPVEDTWIDVNIDTNSETWKLYEYYCKYIETSINIFGSFDAMQQAHTGNQALNISAITICNRIASENGWNEHLDMNYEFNRKIDELYNPNNLRLRATQTYEIIKNRINLIANYEEKLRHILEIVNDNPNDKILIISKCGEFSSKVTEYLNSNSESDICGNYHNKVDNIPAVDENGNPIFIKSGKEKGKRKSMGCRAQMSLNELRFNLNKIRCLSLSNAPDKSLNVDFDTIIITSPLCEDIKSYLYRLNNINLKSEKIKLFSVFCKNTIEQQKLFSRSQNDNHMIVNKEKFVVGDENNFDFFVAD